MAATQITMDEFIAAEQAEWNALAYRMSRAAQISFYCAAADIEILRAQLGDDGARREIAAWIGVTA